MLGRNRGDGTLANVDNLSDTLFDNPIMSNSTIRARRQPARAGSRRSAALSAPQTGRSPESGVAAYRELRDAITAGRFQPNERLVEADLARTLGAGRTAIRAALVRLDQEGLVSREPNRGARVRLVSEREALEIEEVRVSLEQLLVGRAATNVTPADLRDLRQTIEAMRERVAQGDPLGYSELNARFHQRIWDISDNQTARRVLANLKSQSIRFQYRTILRPGRTEQSLEEHEAIVSALAARDPEAAEAAMRTHLSQVVSTLKWSIDSQTRPPSWLPG
jgi:DNA-binding GntR family transcriptional regulator